MQSSQQSHCTTDWFGDLKQEASIAISLFLLCCRLTSFKTAVFCMAVWRMGRGSTDQKSCEGFYIYLVLHFLSDNNPEKKKREPNIWRNVCQDKCRKFHSFNCFDAIIFWERNIVQLCSPQRMLTAIGNQLPVKSRDTPSLTGGIIEWI